MNLMFKLFSTFFKIGAFTIGGGYAMLPFIQKEVVEEHKWLTTEEFIDILAIAEATPGPIAVNVSTYVGYKKLGYKGALMCTLGTILPSFMIILVVARFLWEYRQSPIVEKVFMGIRPAVAALIFSAVYKLGKNISMNYFMVIGALVTIVSIVFLSISPILIILTSAIGSIVYFKIKEKRI